MPQNHVRSLYRIFQTLRVTRFQHMSLSYSRKLKLPSEEVSFIESRMTDGRDKSRPGTGMSTMTVKLPVSSVAGVKVNMYYEPLQVHVFDVSLYM